MIATQSASVRSPACLDVQVPVHYFTSGRPVRCRAELRLLLERALRRVGAERAELDLGALLAPPCLRPHLGPSPCLGLSVPPVDGSATGLQVLHNLKVLIVQNIIYSPLN